MSRNKHPPDATRAVAYIRCSTLRQDLSPDAQRASMSAWAERNSVTPSSRGTKTLASAAAPRSTSAQVCWLPSTP